MTNPVSWRSRCHNDTRYRLGVHWILDSKHVEVARWIDKSGQMHHITEISSVATTTTASKMKNGGAIVLVNSAIASTPAIVKTNKSCALTRPRFRRTTSRPEHR